MDHCVLYWSSAAAALATHPGAVPQLDQWTCHLQPQSIENLQFEMNQDLHSEVLGDEDLLDLEVLHDVDHVVHGDEPLQILFQEN